jgi:hypothetical protein
MMCDVTNNACVPAVVAGCCAADSECDDGDPCTFDSCDETACSHAEIEDCVLVQPDAGVPDGATPDGAMPDGGAELDGGSAVDGGSPADAGTMPDSGSGTTEKPAKPGIPFDDDSCECTSHRRTGGASPWLLLALLVAVRSVRRIRS